MNSRIFSGILLAGLFGAGAAYAVDCSYPKAPSDLPDGRTASEQDMVSGMKAVKDYNAQVTAYLDCLDAKMNEDLAKAGPEASADLIEQIKGINAKRHNAAIVELEENAERFNEQVRVFKAREKEEKEKRR